MEYRRSRTGTLVALVMLAVGIAVFAPAKAVSVRDDPGNNVIARELAVEKGEIKATKFDKGLSDGVMAAVYASTASGGGGGGTAPTSARAAAQSDGDNGSQIGPPPVGKSNGCPKVRNGGDDEDNHNGRDDEGNGSTPDNIRVNQDCSLRRQAEEIVAVNPRDFSNIIAGQNDSRIGFNHCGYDWSLNGGSNWGDTGTAPPPFWQFILKDGHTSDACSDPSGTFDHLGNAYITGVLFDITSPAAAIIVAKSNWPNRGTFYHTARPVPFQEYSTSPMSGPASDNDPNIFHDKEMMIGDTRPASPKKGRVYMTWTRFETNGTPVGGRSPIVFSQSRDGGATWSRAVIISGASGSFCTVFSGTPDNPNACDQDQGSDPVVGPDGTIYVVYGNGNTPEAGVNQVLMVRCPPVTPGDCDLETDWQGPFLVGSLIGTHPIGDPGNAGGCPTGRQCLPPNGYRVPEFTSMSIAVDKQSRLSVTWADHRNNTNPKCGPIAWSTASPPCDHDVFYAYSLDRGTTWSPTITVTPRSRLGETAQWQPWHDVSGDGKKVQVAFYDRHYDKCEFKGCNDITLATLTNPYTPTPTIKYQRITTSSMPNLVPANNPVQAGFLGDYMWVEVSRHSFEQKATHIVWADTRQLFGPAPEEDVYYAKIGASSDDRGD